jgi:DNA-binding NarL/FixJ family response regulator
LDTNENSASATDPWRDSQPECRLYPDSPWFQKLIRDCLGDAVRIVGRPDAGPREAILVDCIETANGISAARRLYPSHAVVGVLAREDAGRILEILAGGADGVIALTDPPETWRQCLHVVLGGGRWLGGPGLEVKLQHKYTSYDVAKRERHAGDVTMRTKLFVKGSVGDKVRS